MLYVHYRTDLRSPRLNYLIGSGCAVYAQQGINPYSSLAAETVLKRSVVDLASDPFQRSSFTSAWSDDPRFGKVVRVGGTPELPTLPEWRSNVRYSAPNKNWKERKAAGEIVVSPMTRTTLVLQDTFRYVPGKPVVGSAGLYALTRLETPTRTQCGHQVVEHEGRTVLAQSLGSLNLQNNGPTTANLIYYKVTDPTAVAPLIGSGMSEAKFRALHQLLIQGVRSLPRDKAMVTSVIAQTRSGTYDLLTDTVELKSTLQTLFSCVMRILTAYKDMVARTARLSKVLARSKFKRKRSKRQISAAEKRSSNARLYDSMVRDYNQQWLEFRYGIRPIILSANSAIEWLNNREYEYAKFRGLTTQSTTLVAGDLSVTVPVVIDRAFGKVRLSGSTAGLKLNPLSTALELVPMSLLLNWVCNIGDVLSACYPPSAAKQEVYSVSRSIPKGLYPATYAGVPITVELSFYELDVINPYRHISFQIGPNMSWQRFIDAFAFAYKPLKKALFTPKGAK